MEVLLKFISFFNVLETESANKIIDLARIEHFKKNDFLAIAGVKQKYFYIIKSGIVRSYYIDKNGKTHIRNFFIKMNTSGDIGSLISDTPANLNYDCLSDCEVYVISYKKFIDLVNNDHQIAKFYGKVLAKVVLLFEAKIYDLSILNATERYLKLKKEIPNIENLIQQYHIASYLNITPIQLSRIRKKFYSK